MTRKRTKTDHFKDLTWEDLQAWAGGKILSRGKSYQRNGYVKELAKTPDGGLVASVYGTGRYDTRVFFEDGDLESVCSCPYWDTCKHAVAVVLEYLDQVKKGIAVALVSDWDPRLGLLEDLQEDNKEDQESYGLDDSAEAVEVFLKKRTKAELIDLLKNLAGRYPLVQETLRDMQDLTSGATENLVKAVRKEIRELSAEPGWMNYWKHEGYIPDYSKVRDRLKALLDEGHADEVLALGQELLDAGTPQVEMSHDEGETAAEIASCMDVVFQALPQSSLPPVEKMLWAVEVELQDEYGLCQGAEIFWNLKHAVEDWNILAERLIDRLTHFRPAKGEDRFLRDYLRDRLTGWVIHALANAGRHEEIIPLCEREAEKTRSYVRLVDLLLEAKRLDEAEKWIHKGIRDTRNEWPGIANKLRTALREMREEEGDWLRVAAFRAEDFFSNPILNTFQELRKAAELAEVWSVVRTAAMNYLETGKLPQGDPSWPLPETRVGEAIEPAKWRFPLCETLVDIAIAEERPDEVIRWYDEHKSQKSSWRWSGFKDDKIAEVLVDRYPERALGIWKELAQIQISQTKPKAYEIAAGYLRKVQHLLQNHGKEREWQSYLGELRRIHARKRRLLEILDIVAGRRIID